MIDDATLRLLEFGSYLVTVVGLPLAVFALWRDARAERENERKEIEQRDEETYLRLSEQYAEFVGSVLQYPELGLKMIKLAIFCSIFSIEYLFTYGIMTANK